MFYQSQIGCDTRPLTCSVSRMIHRRCHCLKGLMTWSTDSCTADLVALLDEWWKCSSLFPECFLSSLLGLLTCVWFNSQVLVSHHVFDPCFYCSKRIKITALSLWEQTLLYSLGWGNAFFVVEAFNALFRHWHHSTSILCGFVSILPTAMGYKVVFFGKLCCEMHNAQNSNSAPKTFLLTFEIISRKICVCVAIIWQKAVTCNCGSPLIICD